MKIEKMWETFLKRKVFLSDHLVFQLGHDGAVKCSDINELVASLIFIDLISVLDAAMKERLRAMNLSLGSRLFDRINTLAQAGMVADSDALDRLRRLRNGLAHDVQKLPVHELNAGITIVERELQGWGFAGPRPNYVAFHDSSRWSKRDTEGGSKFVRDFSIGVRVADTGEVVLSYDYEQEVDNPELISLMVTAQRRGEGYN